MDRKKTIVTAVMINAGILTVLFIAAMSMREVAVDEAPGKINSESESEAAPLFKEVVEIPPAMTALVPSETARFTLRPIAAVEVISSELLVLAPLPAALAADEVQVEKGTILDRLAKKYQTSVDEIIKLNQLPAVF